MNARGTVRPRPQMTHCYQGHEFTPDNTYVDPKGGRNCRICIRARRKRNPTEFQVTCPDCGVTRTLQRPARSRVAKYLDGVCQPCATVRTADLHLNAPVRVTDELREWWTDRYSPHEIFVLASWLIPQELEREAA